MRRSPAFCLAANFVCALAGATDAAEPAPPPKPMLRPFDASAYAPQLPLPDGWRTGRFDDECQRWICRDWPDRKPDCRGDPEVFADWFGVIGGREIGVSVSVLLETPGWPTAVKALHRRFSSRACKAWRGPRGRVEECFGRFGHDADAEWSLERIEERPTWILKIHAGGFGLPSDKALAGVRFTFFDGPLGPRLPAAKRRR